jgi:antitoxin component of MazEF toxin-antitoxin module
MVIVGLMVIVRRLMRQHSSVVLSVPKALCQLVGLKAGDYVSVRLAAKNRGLVVRLVPGVRVKDE